MNFTVSISDVVATLAFVLSGIATWKTIQFNKRQQSLIESQERLNQLMIEKGVGETESSKKADLGATFIRLGNNKIRLKIWNKGQATARNVQVSFPEETDIVSSSEVEEKFPLEALEQYQSVELVAFSYIGVKRKHAVLLSWSDEFSLENEKTVYPTM